MRQTFTIKQKEYPCRQTMGAFLRFKTESGKDVAEMAEWSINDFCLFLWCSIVSACNADGVEFGISFMDFADAISPADLTKWIEEMAGSKVDEKKSPQA